MSSPGQRRVSPAVHPTAWVAPSADVVGEVTIGPEASIWYGCVLRGDVAPIEIGARSNLQDLSVVHVDRDRPTRIGEDVAVGHRALIHGCEIESGSLVGMGAIVLSHARIGAGSLVAAGAVVPEGMEIPPGSLVVGVPGRVIRPVDAELAHRIRRTVSDYRRLKEEHRAGSWRPLGGSPPTP